MNYKLEKVGMFRKYKPQYKSGDKIVVGSSVKLVFKLLDNKDVNAERVWAEVTKVGKNNKAFEGYIDNDTIYLDLRYKDKVKFSLSNVYDIDNSE